MARPREFDRNTVLDKALAAFWDHGFEETSLAILVERMGISRASLYDTFGSKDALFAEVVDRYEQRMRDEFLAPLRGPGKPLKILRQFFYNVADRLAATEGPTCLVIKASSSSCKNRGSAGAALEQCLKTVDDAFHDLLIRARDGGQIDRSRQLRPLSRLLTSLLHGLNVRAAVRPERRILRGIVREGLTILD